MFEPVSGKVDFPGQEREVLQFWEREGIFRKSLERRRGAPEFVFFDGPPFATGLPHYGHHEGHTPPCAGKAARRRNVATTCRTRSREARLPINAT